MSQQSKTAIHPRRDEDYPLWYQAVIRAADLAEPASVRGCMIMKPLGCALWERMQAVLNTLFQGIGSQNVYFPLLMPLSALNKEAQHVDGFATECAVVTHRRLSKQGGQLVPDGLLEEPLVIRPTSEVIVGEAFSRWIQSHRDLPLKINQWANIVRWEMRPRLFLRTSEFLWQEGHTAHATAQEALDQAYQMAQVYRDFAQDVLATPVILGTKTAAERFPGAKETYTIEAMMQDRKALQAGTSHFLGQNFSRAFSIQFTNDANEKAHVWTTSWGVSTRLIGGLIMTHSDDNGLVLPPKIAPCHCVIMPMIRDEADRKAIMDFVDQVTQALRATQFHGAAIKYQIDDSSRRLGEKNWHWIKRGMPCRIEVGMREVAQGQVMMAYRHEASGERASLALTDLSRQLPVKLEAMQQTLYQRAQQRLDEQTYDFESKEALMQFFEQGAKGFARFYWIEDVQLEQSLKKKYQVTMRCYPDQSSEGACIFTGQSGGRWVIAAKAY